MKPVLAAFLMVLLLPITMGGAVLISNHQGQMHSCQAFNKAAAGESLLISQLRDATASSPTRSAAYKKAADKKFVITLGTLVPQDCQRWTQ